MPIYLQRRHTHHVLIRARVTDMKSCVHMYMYSCTHQGKRHVLGAHMNSCFKCTQKSCVRCRHEVRCTHDTASYKSIGISGYRPLAHICIHLSLSFLRMHALSSKSTHGMTHSSLYMTQSSRRHTLLTDYRLSISVCLSIYAQAYLIETGTINPYICIPIDYISIYEYAYQL